jgi:cell division protein FtsZ
VARLAREAGALVVGLVAMPFDCEGTRRSVQAQHGLERLKTEADGVLCLHNQKVFALIDENTTVIEAFDLTSRYIVDGLRGIWQLMNRRGLIDVHFADLCSVLRGRHTEGSFALAEATGPNRSIEVLDRLLTHPFLDGGQVLGFANEVVVSLMGGADLTMQEVNRVMEQLAHHCGTARITMGAAIDEEFNNRLCVTLFTTCRQEHQESVSQEESAGRSEDRDNRAAALEIGQQLLDCETGRRPPSRVVPPAPQLDEQTREQLMARKAVKGARARQASKKMKQAQLPLEVISRGRFDKSEPTIHKGEDLDLPTYIRRGVVLN